MKTKTKTNPNVTFTRAEFELFLSLVEDEVDSPLSNTNQRYHHMLVELCTRLQSVARPGELNVTDACVVHH